MFSEEEVKEALDLLEVAKKDCEVAKLLLENRYYPQGLFYLQQSIEKATKVILRALGLADIETLRKEIGHEILVKGLRRIGYETLGKLEDEFSRMFIGNLVVFCQLISLCPNAYRHIDEMIRSTVRSSEKIQEWLNKKYDKEIKSSIDRLSNIIFQENRDAEREVDKILDDISMYLINITEAIKKFGAETLIVSYWRFEKAMRDCLRRHSKNRNQLAKTLTNIDYYNRLFIDRTARIFYLLIVYLLLLVYHTLFENKVSMLRYPNKNWTPLSISDNSTIVKESRKIVDFTHGQELLEVVGDFIKGEMVHNKSKNAYVALAEYIKALKNTVIN